VTTLSAFLADSYAAELTSFRASLDGVPDDAFGTARTGHAAAWHALHVSEWLRLVVLDDRTPNYQHLGWENTPAVQTLTQQPAPVQVTADKAAILAELDRVTDTVVRTLRDAGDEGLSGTVFSAALPGGQRPRLPALGAHLAHIAYHRGQVQLARKS